LWPIHRGGLEVNEVQRLHELENENSRLKRLVAGLSLDREMLNARSQKTA
jgi:putative transposase